MLHRDESDRYYNYLIIAAVKLEKLSCLVYKDEAGNSKKPKASIYFEEVFESWTEYPEDVRNACSMLNEAHDKALEVYMMLWALAKVVCPMMSCEKEQAFVRDYAYAIEYVVKHDGNLDTPNMQGLVPLNYIDFNYNEGINHKVEDQFQLALL
jgi:hypothetical protein